MVTLSYGYIVGKVCEKDEMTENFSIACEQYDNVTL